MFWLEGGLEGIFVNCFLIVLFVMVKVFGWSKLCFKSIFIIKGILFVWCKFVVMYLLLGFKLYNIGILVLIILKLFKDNFIFVV